MDIFLKVVSSFWVVLVLCVFVFSWVGTWFVIPDEKKNNIGVSILGSIIGHPIHCYIIWNGMMYLDIGQYYYIFLIWASINKIKDIVANFMFTRRMGVYSSWEIVLYIPGIIYILSH